MIDGMAQFVFPAAYHTMATALERGGGIIAGMWAQLRETRSLTDARRFVFKSYPLQAVPLRIRPFFISTTAVVLILLSLLGFHPTLARHVAPESVPFSDKILHFVCFCGASMLFYKIWKVDDSALHVWFWRYWAELVSVCVCTLVGGIFSEVVQSLLPYKTFQWGDVVANILGSSLGIFILHKTTVSQRKRKALRQVYEPVGGYSEYLSDDELEEQAREVPHKNVWDDTDDFLLDD